MIQQLKQSKSNKLYQVKLRRSGGAALVVALLIAALVAVMGVRIGNEYQMTFRRASNVMFSDQTRLFLISAENIAKQLLAADEEHEKDFAGEPWATPFPPVPIGNGLIAPDPIVDLQGRFNINSLASPQPPPNVQGMNFTASQKMFIRLLRAIPDIDMDQQRAEAIVNSIADWLDEDSNERGFDGAEDGYYSQLDVPYRAANVAFVSVSELRLIKGIDTELYRAVSPYLSALDTGEGKININSASATVLRALCYDGADELLPLDEQSVSSYLESYEPAVGLTKGDFFVQAPWKTILEGKEECRDSIEASSNYFLVSARARLGELTLPMRSILHRTSNENGGEITVEVLSRSTGSL
ncbi:MAG: type II secretion system minor pseudopilin GspK [Pseudomonadales bacterium]